MSEPLWSARDLAAAVNGQWRGEAADVSAVAIDSRAAEQGSLFIAIDGENQDGHAYCKNALAQGAAAALVHKAVDGQLPLLMVEDTTKALEALGVAARARMAGTLVGITGSVGKTTARALTAQALQSFGHVHATQGNLNNHYGVPLTLARMPQSTDYAVIEMGMNHAGEIRALTQQARPHVAAITTVDAVHLEHFESVASIADAKAEIMDGLVQGGTVCLPADNEYAERLRIAASQHDVKIVWFGTKQGADVRLVKYLPDQCAANIIVAGKQLHVPLPQASLPVAMNACVALAIAYALDLDVEQAADALAHTQLEAGRGGTSLMQYQGRNITLVDDSYNASPASMRAALQTMCEQAGSNRVIAVLGDMLELGDSAAQFHAALKGDVERAALSGLVCLGEHMAQLAAAKPTDVPVRHAKNVDEVIVALDEWLQDGDILLLKGSHGTGLYQLPELLAAR